MRISINNLSSRRKKQGVALVFAISVTAILLLMTYALLALSHSTILLQKEQKKHLYSNVSLQNTFNDNIITNSAFKYDTNLVLEATSENKVLADGTAYTVETSNSHLDNASNERFNAFIVPENGYTMSFINHYIKIILDDNEKNITIRVPSKTSVSRDGSIDNSIISLNIPAINFRNIGATQLIAGNIIETDVGHIGDLSVDRSTNKLRFTDINGLSQDMSFPSIIDLGVFQLSQGWLLNGGYWELSVAIFNTSSHQGCVIKSTLYNFLNNFSSLRCVSLDNFTKYAKYPNPAGFPICISKTRYAKNYVCNEDGILFIAIKNNARAMPLRYTNKWRLYYPTDDWVEPYTEGGRYYKNSLVVFDGILFRYTSNIATNKNPFVSKFWVVEGVYEWNDRVIKYYRNNVVTYNNELYKLDNANTTTRPPTNDRFWTRIDTYDGKIASEYVPYKIVFPYRKANVVLNCDGSYPSIDTDIYKQCILGNLYARGSLCYENNILFSSKILTTESPSTNPNSWQLSLPSSDWVVPFSYNVQYGNVQTKVLFDDMFFINRSSISVGTTPYVSAGWEILDIYEWVKVTYFTGDVVIERGDFYIANYENKNKKPSKNSKNESDEWTKIGPIYNGQTTAEVFAKCTLN